MTGMFFSLSYGLLPKIADGHAQLNIACFGEHPRVHGNAFIMFKNKNSNIFENLTLRNESIDVCISETSVRRKLRTQIT